MDEIIVTTTARLKELIGAAVREGIQNYKHPDPPPPEKTVKASVVCAELNICHTTLRKYTKSGLLQAYNPDPSNSTRNTYLMSEVWAAWRNKINYV